MVNTISIIISIIFLLVLIVLFLVKKNKTYKFLSITWFVLIILELTLFNYKYYMSLNYKEVKFDEYTVAKGIKQNVDGSLTVISNKYRFIEIYDINQEIKNIYLELDITNASKSHVIDYAFGFTDDANELYRSSPDRTIYAKKGYGEIVSLKLNGKTSKLRIYFNSGDNINFKIENIIFNKRYDFNYSLIRMICLFVLILIIYFFRPSSNIYKIKLSDVEAGKTIKKVIVTEIVCLTIMFPVNGYFVFETFTADVNQRNQYKLLAESFLKGKVELDIEPSDILKELLNPYDTKMRKEVFKGDQSGYIWDVAYYNKKYYVYFGVAPVIFLYLPFYLLTGIHINTAVCDLICVVLTVIGIFILLKRIASMWYKNTSLGIYLLLTLMVVNGCGIINVIGRPDHYYLPIIMGLMFTVYGLNNWLKAYKSDNWKDYFKGSLCMALVAACRPQMLLMSFVALPLFWSKVNKNMFNKKNIGKVLAFVLPYIMVALPLMYYNFIRFGSPFDFGANYNLTTNDMTKRGWVWARLPLGIFYYLFNPINLSLKFPFVSRSALQTNYFGTTIYETMGMGFFNANILCIFSLLSFKLKNKFKSRTTYLIATICTLFAFVIIIVDTEMAGILPRYFLDFSFMLYLSTFLTVLLFNKELNKYDSLKKILLILLIFIIVYNVLFQLCDSSINNSIIFSYLRRIFEFWV